jgi:hypothetical protein
LEPPGLSLFDLSGDMSGSGSRGHVPSVVLAVVGVGLPPVTTASCSKRRPSNIELRWPEIGRGDEATTRTRQMHKHMHMSSFMAIQLFSLLRAASRVESAVMTSYSILHTARTSMHL